VIFEHNGVISRGGQTRFMRNVSAKFHYKPKNAPSKVATVLAHAPSCSRTFRVASYFLRLLRVQKVNTDHFASPFIVGTLGFVKKNIFANSKKKETNRAGSHVSTLSPVSAAATKTT